MRVTRPQTTGSRGDNVIVRSMHPPEQRSDALARVRDRPKPWSAIAPSSTSC
jgi:hypothetical protein